MTTKPEWPVVEPEVQKTHNTNPFWSRLCGSNPFLDDIVNTEKDGSKADASILNANTLAAFADNADSISTSSDEATFTRHLNSNKKSTKRSELCKSASDILDVKEGKTQRENFLSSSSDLLSPDFEWLKNDREAYKLAWLSHRQLTRSCLDLGHTSPGWAQTQATETQIICKIGHRGGSVQLPYSNISAHIPEGHVSPEEVQEIGLKAILDTPSGLCNDHLTTLGPLLEVTFSNLNVKECIFLEMKVAGEIKSDPLSQVMTKLVCLVSQKREGPFEKLKHCYTYNNTMQVKLEDLKPHLYVIAAAQATVLQPPVTSVWDYMDRHLTVGIYGPRHIHPSFKAFCVIFCHSEIPPKLLFSNIKKGDKNLPPLVLQLWGKQHFSLNGLKDLNVATAPMDSKFEIKTTDQIQEVKKEQLKMCQVVRLPLSLSKTSTGEVSNFNLVAYIKDSTGSLLTSFQVKSPSSIPQRSEKLMQKQLKTSKEKLGTESFPEEITAQIPRFQDKPINIKWYGVTLKSVYRQPRVEYLLEYFKGDTLALLSRHTVKSVGQSKVKEWYIGYLRGRVGLVHCKNIKLITKDQVIDFSDVAITTKVLLDNISLPFRKLTYMYSTIETLVTEAISNWKTFAEALGFSNLSLDKMTWRQAESESEKVAYILEKLKEDCHTEKNKKKFQHELIVGLLKMNSQDLVARLTQSTVILSTAVELGGRWRELAERLGKLSSGQIASYEAPHRGRGGEVSTQSMWKPAYDFLYTWSKGYGSNYKDLIQDLHLALDKMKVPVSRQWREITGVLVTVNCMEILSIVAFSNT
ncbi:metastasis-associated in colon cancer protein 1-like [Scleropages formosus]|nr:metastasis-associated in colon cancer protein 1-like [Scleropages formosus]